MGLFDSVLGFVGGMIGGDADRDAAKANNIMNYEWNKEFAQNSIQWRKDDAIAAGLHPLAALGANVSMPGALAIHSPGGSAQNYAEMGQSLGRAIDATMTKEDRTKKDIADSLALENAKLKNDLLRSQVTMVQKATNPPFPNGRSVTGDVQVMPDEITASRPGDRATTAAGPKPATLELYNRDGSVVSFPSPDAKQAIEDNIIYEVDHFARNRIVPWIARRYTDLYDMATRKNASYRTNPYY